MNLELGAWFDHEILPACKDGNEHVIKLHEVEIYHTAWVQMLLPGHPVVGIILEKLVLLLVSQQNFGVLEISIFLR